MPSRWRLIDSGVVSPQDSAAIDEAILEAHTLGKVPNTLHLYVRSRPTISMGYFQKVAESVDMAECEQRGVAIVRRRSGGSSIFTDSGQLIYGLVLSETDLPEERTESFRVICGAVASALRSFGVDATYRPLNDVEVGGRKVSGNAQLRRKQSVLQHGTIVIDTDTEMMDAVLKVVSHRRGGIVHPSDRVTTLAKVLGEPPDLQVVKKSLQGAFEEAFNVRFDSSALTEFEQSMVKTLVEERYSRKEWNLKF